MNVQLPVHMDKTAFLAWVQGREERYELVGGRVVMMTGASRTHGILVLKVKRSSAADAAGLARGDLVTGAGGADVRTIGDLHRAVRHARGTLALDVVRGAEERSVEVALSRSS